MLVFVHLVRHRAGEPARIHRVDLWAEHRRIQVPDENRQRREPGLPVVNDQGDVQRALREVLARLDTRQQALILGHAVPMPVVVRTRDYDQSFYAAIGVADESDLDDRAKMGIDSLYGE